MASKDPAPAGVEGPPGPGSKHAPLRGKKRGRALRWIAGGLGALVALSLGLVAFIGADLDRPWIKSRLLERARAQGWVVDYEGLSLSLGRGVRARSFRLRTPPALAAGAEDFVRVDDFELSAPLWKLAFGGRTIEGLRLGHVSVWLVSDESGRSTLSELFPPEPEPEPEPAASRPLSRSLEGLPRLSLHALEVGRLEGHRVELFADGSRRSSDFSGLGLRGELQSGAEGLLGTRVEVVGAPLTVELSDRGSVQHARLGFDSSLKAPNATSLALGLHVDLEEQDVVPSWGWRGALLELESTVRFDAAAGKTTIALAPLAALRDDLSIVTTSDVFDGEKTRVTLSGKAHVDLAGLPFAVPGLALEALKIELASQELSWDGSRVSGTLDASGSLRAALLEQGAGDARVSGVTLSGHGAFQPEGGRFQATLKAASAASRSPEASTSLDDVTLELAGTTRELAGAQQIEAQANLVLAALHLTTPAEQKLDVAALNLRARASGSAIELAARTLPRLDAELALASLSLGDAVGSTRLESPKLNAVVLHLTEDAGAELGVQGDATLSLSVPALRQYRGARSLRQGPGDTSLGGLELRATLPLSLARAQGTLGLASLRSEGKQLERLALEVQAESPLAWASDHDGTAQATLRGEIARLDAGAGNRGVLSGLRLVANKLGPDRYRVELDARGSSLALGGLPLPGEVVAEVRADAQPVAGVLKLTSSLHGAGGATLTFGADASFERASERLRYAAELSAERLEAFAGVASKLDARAARLELAGAHISGSARGDLTGVLRAAPDGSASLAPNPLGSARGTESARFELAGLDYRAPDRALRVPELAFEIESTHRAELGGNASARLRVKSLELDGDGTSLRVDGLDQRLVATFDRAPDQGVIDVHTQLALGAVAQSWLPAYPVKELTFTSNVQIDRLSSIYLRELVLDNPASGSSLHAQGTLELLAQGSPDSGKTIVGREALSFDGRLAQKLAPLERLGLAAHATGSVELPFRLESGGLLGYRLLATLEAKDVSFVAKGDGLGIEGLNGAIPVVEEFALLESGPVIGAGPRTSPLSDTRFFDVHPFLALSDYVTARSISLGGLAPLGPIAANVRVERSEFIIDQLQTGYRGGQIVGQVRVAWRDGDPIVRLRLNATGVRSGKSNDVFDANTALTFLPGAMTLDGKVQIVRASRDHVENLLDVLDPFHESANANRVRQALALGYPKFVRFQLHDGAVDTKVELGGLAQLVRIDEIKAVPLGPILQKYVAPSLSGYLRPSAPPSPTPAPDEATLESALRDDAAEAAQPRVER